MLAFALTALDAPPELRDVPRPVVRPDEILVHVLSSSINPVDELVATGFFRSVQEYRFPAVFGRDLCGVVEEVGDGVTRFEVGQTVWGFVKREYIGDGTFAEFVAVPADYFVALKPPQTSVIEAGAMGLASITALECLDVLELGEGDSVFINRATGGVGSFAVQIAAARGQRVIATARPGESESFVRGLGANDVVDWTTGDLAAEVLRIAPDGVDGMVDLVRRDMSAYIGMDESDSQSSTSELAGAILRPAGRFSSVTNGADDDLLARGIGFNVHSQPTPENLETINSLVEAGLLRTPVTAVFPFQKIADAFDYQRSAGRGKIAVSFLPTQ